jgi:hypothetical protein
MLTISAFLLLAFAVVFGFFQPGLLPREQFPGGIFPPASGKIGNKNINSFCYRI